MFSFTAPFVLINIFSGVGAYYTSYAEKNGIQVPTD
jgi:hypothetical protein